MAVIITSCRKGQLPQRGNFVKLQLPWSYLLFCLSLNACSIFPLCSSTRLSCRSIISRKSRKSAKVYTVLNSCKVARGGSLNLIILTTSAFCENVEVISLSSLERGDCDSAFTGFLNRFRPKGHGS